MELLSGAASGIAVVSLTLQLIQSANTISTFVRRVKDAPKELLRLADLLEQLSTLLEDVRQLLERQSALEQHFQAPSGTICMCIQSCTTRLAPLENIITMYQKLLPHEQLSMTRWKHNLEFGIKGKDIAGLENHLSHEISRLATALVVNNSTTQ
jgi:hypothetical protein